MKTFLVKIIPLRFISKDAVKNCWIRIFGKRVGMQIGVEGVM